MPSALSLLIRLSTRSVFLASFLVCGSGLAMARPIKTVSAKRSVSKKRKQAPSRPVAAMTRSGQPNVQAQSAIVVDLESGEELFTKNPDEVRPIASISKLTAMLVVLDHQLDFDAITTVLESDAQIARGGARSRLFTGEGFTNRDLLHAALMASDNRAVPALGRAVGLTPQQMVLAMNKKAQSLALAHTHFEDPVGLNVGNVSTARDLVGVLRAATKNTIICEISKKATYIAHVAQGKPRAIEYTNTDQIARGNRYQVLTGKTGYTDVALYCLAIAAQILEGKNVAMVFLGANGKETRFADFNRVAEWLVQRKWSGRVTASSTKPM